MSVEARQSWSAISALRASKSLKSMRGTSRALVAPTPPNVLSFCSSARPGSALLWAVMIGAPVLCRLNKAPSRHASIKYGQSACPWFCATSRISGEGAHGQIRHDLRHQELRYDEKGARLAGTARRRLRLP